MSNEVAKVAQTDFMSIIERVALDPNVDVEKMSRILDMQEKVFDKNSQIAFNKSMVQCQKNMPTVARDSVNQQTNSSYAKFETILNAVKPTYTNHGFSLSFGTEASNVDGYINIICDVMHEDGYTKRYQVDLPLDNVGIKGTANKTAVHGTGSTYSYGKRYLITMIFNIAIANEDDDAVTAGKREYEDNVKKPVVEFFMRFTDAISRNIESIQNVKIFLDDEDYLQASGWWFDMTEEDRNTLFLAPTKGGILTTKQREMIKSDPFTAAYRTTLETTK